MNFITLEAIANTFVNFVYANGLAMDFAAMLDCDERNPFLRKALQVETKSYLEYLQEEGDHEVVDLIELLAGSQYWKYEKVDKKWKRLCEVYDFRLRS